MRPNQTDYGLFPDEDEVDEENVNFKAIICRASASLLFITAVTTVS